MPGTSRLLAREASATDCEDRAPTDKRRAAVLALWKLQRFDTCDIAEMLEIHEADVERIIHADREARRKAAA
jgi:hypothetical protein